MWGLCRCRLSASTARLSKAALHGRPHPAGKPRQPNRQQRHPGLAPDIGVFDECAGRIEVEDVVPSLAADRHVAAPDSGVSPGDPAVRLEFDHLVGAAIRLATLAHRHREEVFELEPVGPNWIPAENPGTV